MENVTSTSVSVFWINLEFLISEQVLHYITLLRSANGSSVLNAVITSGNTTSGNISGLSTYTEYQITIVGVRSDGQGHNSSKSTFWTEEGGKLHLTCQLRKFIVSFFIFHFPVPVFSFRFFSFKFLAFSSQFKAVTRATLIHISIDLQLKKPFLIVL